MKKFIIVNGEGKNVFGKEYSEEGANRIWNMYNGIYEDENGEQRIYIKEVQEDKGMKKEQVTKTYKVHGVTGHRQRESFFESYRCDWSEGNETRVVEVLNSDRTGTNDYTVLRITRNTAEECEEELEGQLYDGIFENSAVGRVEEIDHWEDLEQKH